MICTIEGKQYDIPIHEIKEMHPSWMVCFSNSYAKRISLRQKHIILTTSLDIKQQCLPIGMGRLDLLWLD